MRTIPLDCIPVPPDHILGLRSDWLTGQGEGVEFALSSGAGLGSGLLAMEVTVDGVRYEETANMSAVARAWVNAIVAEHRTPEDATPAEQEGIANLNATIEQEPTDTGLDDHHEPAAVELDPEAPTGAG